MMTSYIIIALANTHAVVFIGEFLQNRGGKLSQPLICSKFVLDCQMFSAQATEFNVRPGKMMSVINVR